MCVSMRNKAVACVSRIMLWILDLTSEGVSESSDEKGFSETVVKSLKNTCSVYFQ